MPQSAGMHFDVVGTPRLVLSIYGGVIAAGRVNLPFCRSILAGAFYG